MPGVVSSRSSHTPCVGSLFSRYPSRLAWSRRGLLTRFTWARCSRGIRHAWRGLVAVFSHTLCGLVVLAVSVTPDVVSSRSSHTPCVGSLFLSGWWLQYRFTGRERGRSMERDNTPFNSLVLQNFSLHALLHVIPPPWGFHLSNPPNRKFAPAKKQNRKQNVCDNEQAERGYWAGRTKEKLLHFLSTPSSVRLLSFLSFKGTKVWLR
jgi:hypothetical protein